MLRSAAAALAGTSSPPVLGSDRNGRRGDPQAGRCRRRRSARLIPDGEVRHVESLVDPGRRSPGEF